MRVLRRNILRLYKKHPTVKQPQNSRYYKCSICRQQVASARGRSKQVGLV